MRQELSKNRSVVLIVDDSEMNRTILIELLKDEYDTLEAENGVEAISLLRQYGEQIDLVLLDIMMPKMDGFGVLTIMNKYHWTDSTPVIMISSESSSSYIERAYDLGATDYITRPYESYIIRRRISNALMLYAKQKRLLHIVEEQVYAKEKDSNMMINVLGHIVEFRNGESGLHVHHIQMMTKLLLQCLMKKTDSYSITEQDVLTISTASALHDIGKICIDDKILNKPGRLTAEEFEIMKTHSMIGANMLKDFPIYQEKTLMSVAYEICRWHHERYDGNGYPDGLKGEAIPISAQVVSVADVYDALTSERCYKKAFSHEEAMHMILDGQCGAFNPILLECLQEVQDHIQEIIGVESMGKPDELLLSKVTEELLENNNAPITTEREGSQSKLLEIERTKRQFFTKGIEEIQFEYDINFHTLMFSPIGADILGVEEMIVHPDESNLLFLGKENLAIFKEHIQQTTPDKPEITMQLLLNIKGAMRWYEVLTHILWSDDEIPKRIGILGRLFDVHETPIPPIKRKNHILQETASGISDLLNQLRKVFDSVRLIDVEHNQVLDDLKQETQKDNNCDGQKCYFVWGRNTCCKECVAREAYARKDQMCRLEFVGDDIYAVVAKYIELDEQPNVIEMIYKVRDKRVFGSLGKTKFIKSIMNYNDKFYRDVLTGAYNRRYYEEYAKELQNIEAVAMIDCDNFKTINDKYGHAAGDVVLYHVSRLIKSYIRSTDMLIRYGGDEFVLLMQNIPKNIFQRKMQELVEMIRDITIQEYPNIKLSVTIGGAYGVYPVDDAVRVADQFMYTGKTTKDVAVIDGEIDTKN